MLREESRPVLSLIAAAARNGAIGKGGVMPWHLPGDLRYFKATTLGKPVIMGQKTWESLRRKPLPQRVNIVLTRQSSFRPEGAFAAHSLEQALALAAREAKGAREIFIIGGAEVFRQALPLADRLYLTEVLADIDGDVFFRPDLDRNLWRETWRSPVQQDEKDDYPYRFLCYSRAAKGAERAVSPALRAG